MAVWSALKIPYLTVVIIICHIKEMYRLDMERAFAKGTEEMVTMGEMEVMEAEMEEVATETEEMVVMGEEMAAIGGDGGG